MQTTKYPANHNQFFDEDDQVVGQFYQEGKGWGNLKMKLLQESKGPIVSGFREMLNDMNEQWGFNDNPTYLEHDRNRRYERKIKSEFK